MATCSACGTTATAVATTSMTTTTKGVVVKTKRGCEPRPFVPSCETQEKLAQCLKTVLCDVLRCLDDVICPTGNPNDQSEFTMSSLGTCLRTAVCSFARCVPDALCPPTAPTGTVDTLACDFAVEQQLSVQEQG